jgi:hypothetical protein
VGVKRKSTINTDNNKTQQINQFQGFSKYSQIMNQAMQNIPMISQQNTSSTFPMNTTNFSKESKPKQNETDEIFDFFNQLFKDDKDEPEPKHNGQLWENVKTNMLI